MKAGVSFRQVAHPLWAWLAIAALFFSAAPNALGDELGPSRTALVRYYQGCNMSESCQPIILIHGIHGTTHEDSGPCGLYEHLQVPGGTIVSDCNWEPLISHLRTYSDLWNRIQIYVFRYESDKGSTTLDLGGELLSALEARQLNDVIIIAHSMGGLVARMMMKETRGYDRVKAAITLATPHHGTPLANREWRNELADLLHFDVEDVTPGKWLNVLDYVFWKILYKSPHLVDDSSKPSRSDLVWSNWNGLFSQAKANMPQAQWEENITLLQSASSEQGNKLITYAGKLEENRITQINDDVIAKIERFIASGDQEALTHVGLEGFAFELQDKLHVLTPSDGMVPLDSALFAGNRSVALRRNTFTNYDHIDMLKGTPWNGKPDGYYGPFAYIIKDLRTIDAFDGVPPRLDSIEIESSGEVTAGTMVKVHIKARVPDTKRVRFMQFVLKDAAGCAVRQRVAVNQMDEEPTVEWRVPMFGAKTAVTLTGEIWPDGDPQACSGATPLLDTLTKGVSVTVQPVAKFDKWPSISLSMADSRSTFLRGDVVVIRVTEKPGMLGQAQVQPLAWRFVWRDGPEGRRFLSERGGILREVPTAQPVGPPMQLLDLAYELPPLIVSENTAPGSYTWKAGLQFSEVFNPANLLAESAPLTYQVRELYTVHPSVGSIRTNNKYSAGDMMVIHYTTTKGSSPAKYDLMLRLTSRATSKQYYFYDNRTDSNRWIHSTPRPMKSGDPQSGSYQIPAPDGEPIVIENSTPSGEYDMLMYFSEVGKNLPVGVTASGFFALETPTEEGGCFVATAAYGSSLALAVRWLREFRDVVLLSTPLGRRFVRAYYERGPAAASVIAENPVLRKTARVALWPIAAAAWLTVHTGPIWCALLTLLFALGLWWIARRGPRIARVGLVVLLLAGIVAAAEIRGTVLRTKPFPAPAASLLVELGETRTKAVSAPDGSFRFTNVPPGTYTITASGPGYVTGSQTAKLLTSTDVVNVIVPVLMTGSRIYEYHLPHTAEYDGWWTFFAVTNPNPVAAEIIFTAHAASGEVLGTSDKLTRLPINNTVSGKPASFFAADLLAKSAWYRIRSSGPLAGLEIFGHTVGALAGFSLPMPESETLYLPHVAHDVQWWTGVSFVSSGVKSNALHLEARNATGELIGTAARPRRMQPGEKAVDTVDAFFGWDFPIDTKWASLKSDAPLTGFELFGTRDMRMLAAIPALGRGGKRLVFSHLPTDTGAWTGVALLNISSKALEARMTAYGSTGELLASSRAIPLGPGERTVGQVQEYFAAWPQNTRYVEVTAPDDLVGLELVGKFDPPLLGGLPALTEFGPTIAYPYVEQNNSWTSYLTIINLSNTVAQVEWSAYSSTGSRLARKTLSVPARGTSTGTLASIFGATPSGTTWVKAATGSALLCGHVQLTRAGSGQFTNYPALPVVSAEQIGATARAATFASSIPELSDILSAIRITPARQGGLKVEWADQRVERYARRLTAGEFASGDIVLSVNGISVASVADLLLHAQRLQSAPDLSLRILDRFGTPRTIRVKNPSTGGAGASSER